MMENQTYDRLLGFSQSLGEDYTGEWRDITPAAPGSVTVNVRASLHTLLYPCPRSVPHSHTRATAHALALVLGLLASHERVHEELLQPLVGEVDACAPGREMRTDLGGVCAGGRRPKLLGVVARPAAAKRVRNVESDAQSTTLNAKPDVPNATHAVREARAAPADTQGGRGRVSVVGNDGAEEEEGCDKSEERGE